MDEEAMQQAALGTKRAQGGGDSRNHGSEMLGADGAKHASHGEGARPVCQLVKMLPVGVCVAEGLHVTDVPLAVATDFGGSSVLDGCEVQIDWGDDSTATSGTLQRQGQLFQVRGDHRYANPGEFRATVTLCARHGKHASVRSRVLVGSTTERFAAGVYRLLVHADISEHLLSELRHLDRPRIVHRILATKEYRTAAVERIYWRTLHCEPSREELTTGLAQLAAGQSELKVRTALQLTPEYFNRRAGGTENGFLRAIYQDLLGRDPEPEEIAAAHLDGPDSRAAILHRIVNRAESRLKHIDDLHQLLGLAQPQARDYAEAMKENSPNDLMAHFVTQARNFRLEDLERLFPILYTDHDIPIPDAATSSVNWPTNRAWNGVFLRDDDPAWEWVPVVQPNSLYSDEAAVSGTAVGVHDSQADLFFTHPFGNDWNFFIAPDWIYLPMIAPSACDLTPAAPWLTNIDPEIGEALKTARAPQSAGGLGLEVPGLLAFEMDRWLVPEAYRSNFRDGDRVAVFGRWIVDCGHDDFGTEIHPPLVLVNARQQTKDDGVTPDPDITLSWVISRPWYVTQHFSVEGEGRQRKRIGLRKHLLDQLSDAAWNYLVDNDLQATVAVTTPFDDRLAYHYIIRPKAFRRSAKDRLKVSGSFTVRTGVNVFVYGNVATREVEVFVVLDPYTYRMPPLPPGTEVRIHLADLPDDVRTQVQAKLDSTIQALKDHYLTENAKYFQQTVNNGVGMIRYDLNNPPPVASSPQDDKFALYDVPIEDVGFRSLANVDDNQIYPIHGHLSVRWERG